MRFALSLLTLVLALSSISLSPTSVHAQYYAYRPYGYGGWYGAGATPYGSMAAGMGQLIQSQGAYNQMTAVAATQMEEAKKLALDNKLKAAQTHYQIQKLNQQNRAEQERYAKTLYAPAPAVKIPRLSASQLDPVTGQIAWPPLLNTADYQPERGLLDSMFAARANDPSTVTYTQVQKATSALREKLDAKITQYATADFFSARHFLESLTEETRYTGFETQQAAAQ